MGILYDLARYARESGRKGTLRPLTPEQLLRLSAARPLRLTDAGGKQTEPSPGKHAEENKESA